ncbi:MAG: NAD(P)/FAD-dependent oxidoreductase [Limnochordaceae bacterium]|nr:NAD(P)/FAD-dependent oxidoreductase [Limnochordaceae bacterium]
MVANHLARRFNGSLTGDRVEIVQITACTKHTYQPGFLFVALGDAPLEHFERDQASLLLPGIRLVVDPAESIDPQAGHVITESGAVYAYDYLIIATGSYPDPSAVPGLAQGAFGFYTAEDAVRLREALGRFEKGRIVLTVDVPHKCPVAPLEMVLSLDAYFRRMGRRHDVELVYTYPINRVHSLPQVAEWAQAEFERREIRWETFFNVDRVDPEQRVVYSAEGGEYPYDLLISVPPHRGAPVVAASGLGDEQGFVPTDRYTLRGAGLENVYVVGDATNLPVSKAGSTAHYEADIVADNVAAAITGEPALRRYDGKVFCFIEAGDDRGTYIEFSYTRPPRPAPASVMLHQFKMAYNEMYWLSARGVL